MEELIKSTSEIQEGLVEKIEKNQEELEIKSSPIENKEMTEEEVIDSYLKDEFVRKNLIEVMLFYKKKIGSGNWFLFDTLFIKVKGAFKASDVKSHLRLLTLMKLVYVKNDKLNRILYRITDTEESRRHVLSGELWFHQEKVKSIQQELDTLKVETT